MQWQAGTSGYSFTQWRGPFYPKHVPQMDWLSWYATQLPAVEINNTFYRMPKRPTWWRPGGTRRRTISGS